MTTITKKAPPIMAPEAYDAVPAPIDGYFIGAYFNIEGNNRFEIYTATEVYSADKEIKLETRSWNEVKSYINSLL